MPEIPTERHLGGRKKGQENKNRDQKLSKAVVSNNQELHRHKAYENSQCKETKVTRSGIDTRYVHIAAKGQNMKTEEWKKEKDQPMVFVQVFKIPPKVGSSKRRNKPRISESEIDFRDISEKQTQY